MQLRFERDLLIVQANVLFPQASFSQSKLASNPPQAATNARAVMVVGLVYHRGHALEGVAVERDVDHLGVVEDLDAGALRRGAELVHQRLATAEVEGVGAAQMQRSGQRRLEAFLINLFA